MTIPSPQITNLTTPRSLRLARALAVVAALGALLMAVAHMGIDLPLLPTQGLGRAVPPAAAAFTLGALVFAAVAWGLRTGAPWAWWLGLVGFLLALQGSAMPYRGVGSAVGIAVSVLGLAMLVLAPTRRVVSPGRRSRP